MPTPAGKRNVRVQVLQPVVVNGVQTWNAPASVVATAWAFIDATAGSEAALGLEPPGTRVSTVTIPYRAAAIRPRMRIAVLDSTRVLEIVTAIDDSSQHIEWVLSCKEVSS